MWQRKDKGFAEWPELVSMYFGAIWYSWERGEEKKRLKSAVGELLAPGTGFIGLMWVLISHQMSGSSVLSLERFCIDENEQGWWEAVFNTAKIQQLQKEPNNSLPVESRADREDEWQMDLDAALWLPDVCFVCSLPTGQANTFIAVPNQPDAC